jgi:hypothetical protein
LSREDLSASLLYSQKLPPSFQVAGCVTVSKFSLFERRRSISEKVRTRNYARKV